MAEREVLVRPEAPGPVEVEGVRSPAQATAATAEPEPVEAKEAMAAAARADPRSP